VVWHHSLPLMNSFNKTEAAVFSCRLCFLRAFPFISFISLQWPPQSPDLNPIETLWGDIKRALRSCRSRNVLAAWRDIPATGFQVLVRQMPARIKDVICAKVGHTKW